MAENYSFYSAVENGIEHISYAPADRKFNTPILMQHGMWHGAWCWAPLRVVY